MTQNLSHVEQYHIGIWRHCIAWNASNISYHLSQIENLPKQRWMTDEYRQRCRQLNDKNIARYRRNIAILEARIAVLEDEHYV